MNATVPANVQVRGPRRADWAAALASIVLDVLAWQAARLYSLIHWGIAYNGTALTPRDPGIWPVVSRLLVSLHVAKVALPALAAAFAVASLRGRSRWLGIPLLAVSLLLLVFHLNIVE